MIQVPCPHCDAMNDCYTPTPLPITIPIECEDCGKNYFFCLEQDEEGHVDEEVLTEEPVS